MADDDLVVRASLRDELTAPLKKVQHEVKRTGDAVEKADRKSYRYSNTLGRLAAAGTRAASRVGRVLYRGVMLGVKALGIAAVAAGYLGYRLVRLAGDAAETQQKFDVVFKGNAKAVTAWVRKTNAAYGITTRQLQDAASMFGIFGKAAGIARKDLPGFSTDLAQAGLDLSSFYNTDPQQAFEAIQSGLAGQVRPLRQFGIFVSQTAVKAKAAQMGLTGELTESQKVMVRQRIILGSMGDATGDLARTSGSLVNKTRALKGRIVELGTQLGKVLAPVATRLVRTLEHGLAPITTRLTRDAPKLAKALAAGDWRKFERQIDRTAGAGGRVYDVLDRMRRRLVIVRAGVRDVIHEFRKNGLDGAIDKLDEVTLSGGHLARSLHHIVDGGRSLARIIRNAVIPGLEDAAPAVTVLVAALLPMMGPYGWLAAGIIVLAKFGHRLRFVADHASALAPVITVLTSAYVAYAIASKLAAIGQIALNVATESNPYVLAATAIAGVAAGVYMLWKHSKTARPYLVALGAALWIAFGPFGWAIGAITAIAAGLVWAYKNVGWFHKAVDKVGRAFKIVGGWIVRAVRVAWQVSEPFRQTWLAIGKLELKILVAAVTSVARWVGRTWARSKSLRHTLALVGRIGLGVFIASLRTALGLINGIVKAGKWIVRKIGGAKAAGGALFDSLVPGGALRHIIPGDTHRPRAPHTGRARAGHRGASGALARTLHAHARYDAATPGHRTITSAIRGHHLGSGDSDHVTGRALDLTGSGLNSYADAVRSDGGFAEFHGSGPGRHLHAAIGDTSRPRSDSDAHGDTGGLTVIMAAGAVQVLNPTSNVDIEVAVSNAIRRLERDRRERGSRHDG